MKHASTHANHYNQHSFATSCRTELYCSTEAVRSFAGYSALQKKIGGMIWLQNKTNK